MITIRRKRYRIRIWHIAILLGIISLCFNLNLSNENRKIMAQTNLLSMQAKKEVLKQDKFESMNTQENSEDITIYRPSDTEIQIYNHLPDGKLIMMRFHKKLWSTWNLGGFFLSKDGKIPSNSFTILAGGTTDWEYVFRVRMSLNSNYFFTGGSHGREFIRNLAFINPETGSKIKIHNGDKLKINKLKILEDTILTTTFEDNSPYASVKRSYLFEPSKISLNTDFKFVDNIYMGTSYVCMLPMTKEYGNHVWFKGQTDVIDTPKSGETLADKNIQNYYGMLPVKEVQVWGDKNPAYRFYASIGSDEMVDNFSNSLKTFYWDINKEASKLYFSKYENFNDTKVTKGSEWKNYAEWEMRVTGF